MTDKKYCEKYLGKIQRMIDALNSCETEGQVNACDEWARNLFAQWEAYEMKRLEKGYCGTVTNSINLIHAFRKFRDMFKLALDRKWQELSKKEEK